MKNPKDILNESRTFIVTGMNPDPEKYAYKIFNKLIENDKIVYGVNPKYNEIDGHVIYPDISSAPEGVDVAVMVVNPRIGITMLDAMKHKGIKTLWLQPGTFDDDFLNRANELEFSIVEACVLAVYAIYK